MEEDYSKKPLLARVLLFLVGFCECVLALAIVYIFKDSVKKSDAWKLEFLDRGAKIGLALSIVAIIILMLTYSFGLGAAISNIA